MSSQRGRSATHHTGSTNTNNALEWWDLRATVEKNISKTTGKPSTGTNVILDQISGSQRAGRLLAVLGPSGSGKTTFLNALSGRLKEKDTNETNSTRFVFNGDVLLNGELVGQSSKSSKTSKTNGDKSHQTNVISYVEQDPKFFSNMTVRETLTLDCRLRDARLTKRECESMVENVLNRYGLTSCADTLVGGDTGGKEVRGISGGEKRRLSIACETAFNFGSFVADGEQKQHHHHHQLVVCDEPTSGLDAFSADRVVSQLAGLAVEQKAVVVCSLHQPRSASWSRAHDVMLLANGGRVAYHGPVSKCIPYFTSIGYECPANYNPAEFLIDLVSIVTDCGVEACENSIDRVDDICRTWRRQKPFVDRQSIQAEYEETKASERNMFDPNRNQKQRTLMTYQDFHNMMHDHTLTRAETTITQENGAPLSFRDFEKTFAKPLETYASKKNSTADNGTDTANGIEKSRFSEEKDDDERDDDDGYKTASTITMKKNEQSDNNENDDENLNEFEKTRKKILSRSGSAEDVHLEKNNNNNNQSATAAAPTSAATKAGGPLKQFVRQVSTTIRSKVTKSASETSANTTTTEFEIYDANGGRNFASFGSTPPSPFQQFQLLVGRSWKQTRREMWVNGVRLVASVGLATAFGSCNFRISKHPSTVKRRVSVLMQSCINNGMLALCRTLNNFPRERLVVRREMRRNVGGYHPGAYFFAKLLVETPIDMLFPVAFGMIVSPMVGLNPAGRQKFVSALALHAASSAALGLAVSAIAPTSETALAVGPCFMVLSIMLGDATGAFGEVPQALKPLSNLSVVKWSFEGVLASEFENLTFDKNDVETDSSKQLRLRAEKKKREKSHSIVYDATKWATSKLESIGPERGEDVLEEFGLKAKGQARDAAKGQFAVFLFNVALAFTALTLKEKQ